MPWRWSAQGSAVGGDVGGQWWGRYLVAVVCNGGDGGGDQMLMLVAAVVSQWQCGAWRQWWQRMAVLVSVVGVGGALVVTWWQCWRR